jgi:uncharacterized protein YhbP (UPF0306 family)
MNSKIIDFLKKQTAASISCVDEINQTYSFSCFFAFNSTNKLLYFKSAESSYHSRMILQKPKVSGTIMPDKLNKLAVKGIQFTGEALNFNDPLCKEASKNYYHKFPLAVAIPGVIWTIRVDQLKMTNNVMGIFEKLSWQREEKESIKCT